MKALSLFAVCVLAKLLVLSGRHDQTVFSSWLPVAYFWQDALVAVLFGLSETLLIRLRFGRALVWLLYLVVTAYIAINVSVISVLSSPLSWPMIGAARGTLWDSIRYHLSFANIALVALVIGVGMSMPFLLKRISLKWIEHRRKIPSQSESHFTKLMLTQSAAALALLYVGPVAAKRVETVGIERNALAALVTTALPRISAKAGTTSAEEWRRSPLPNFDLSSAASGDSDNAFTLSEDLSHLRGVAAGRNIVLVLLESAGAHYLKEYGAVRDPMPNFSELARSALLFENAYSVYPESIKGLFSVLCSRYPALDTDTDSYARANTGSIATSLRAAGYRAALFHSGRFDYLGMRGIVENRGYEIVEDAAEIGGNRESSFGVDEAATVSRALDWIDSISHDQPFFLTYLPIAGHHPYATPSPGPFPAKEESDRYLNALNYADQSLGTLVDGLRTRRLYENTVFVIFGDHGEAFDQHEGNYGHSLFLYDENIKVPYIIAAPALFNHQVRVARPISLIDTCPTILDLIGKQAPADAQGVSALRNEVHMALFLTDYSLGFVGLRDDCWKYIYELDFTHSKLFNLHNDPDEIRDLSSAYPDRVDSYRSHLIRWSASQKALLSKER